MGRKSRADCVERWCSTLHNVCSAVEECREAVRPSVDLSRGREVLATVSTTASRGSPHPALPKPYSTAPSSSLDLVFYCASSYSFHCAAAVLRLVVVHLACLAGRGQEAGIRSATLSMWIKSNPKTQGKLQGWRCRLLLASSSIKPPRGLPQNSACCAEYIITVHRAASSAAKPPVLKSIKYRVVRIQQCVFSRGQRRAGSRVGQGAVPSPELAPPALRTALHSPPPHLPPTALHSSTLKHFPCTNWTCSDSKA